MRQPSLSPQCSRRDRALRTSRNLRSVLSVLPHNSRNAPEQLPAGRYFRTHRRQRIAAYLWQPVSLTAWCSSFTPARTYSKAYSGKTPRSLGLRSAPWTPDIYIWLPLCALCGRDSIRRCAWVPPWWSERPLDLDWVWFSCSPPLSLSWLYHTAWQSIFLWRGHITEIFVQTQKSREAVSYILLHGSLFIGFVVLPYSATENWSLPTEHKGHSKSSGISSHFVPGAMPPSG